MKTGWFSIHRKLEDDWVWKDKPFTKGQAWIDLILLANFEDAKVNLGNQIFTCKRGELMYSLDSLSGRWGWNKSKVRRFLKCLESDSKIDTLPNTKTTHLSILKYNDYQQERNADETQMKRKRNADETQTTPSNNTNKTNKLIIEQEEFDNFRKNYPSTKGGAEVEFTNFKKKHGNWKEILPKLLPSLEYQIKQRNKWPEDSHHRTWKNLRTWINQSCWDEEVPEPPKEQGLPFG